MNLSVIVCPVDFSSSGEAALTRALALAQWAQGGASRAARTVRPNSAEVVGHNERP